MKTRIYEMPCPGCERQVQSEKTVLGVPGGDYEDYPLRKISFECPQCHTRFSMSLPVETSEAQKKWEAGEDLI